MKLSHQWSLFLICFRWIFRCPQSQAFDRRSDVLGIYMKHLLKHIKEDKKIEEVIHGVHMGERWFFIWCLFDEFWCLIAILGLCWTARNYRVSHTVICQLLLKIYCYELWLNSCSCCLIFIFCFDTRPDIFHWVLCLFHLFVCLLIYLFINPFVNSRFRCIKRNAEQHSYKKYVPNVQIFDY